ncbi:energy transducer TonB [Marinobacter sp. ELB17]|uniref:energy transducer TonB n=1 Tax=Marinobacter sp. ELB17 TaxID=270374 RepID=UPI0000F39C38|nr:energy transducer TonB [Marinobacter sp. ELB17]EAZ97706.1 possible energy transducer TonB, C-terminal region [Marinobacter sp. ELB17]
MSTRAHLFILLAAISLTGTILLIALSTVQPQVTIPEGKDPANQTRSIRITLADQAPEPESAAQPAGVPAPRPEPKKQPEPSPKEPAPKFDPMPEPEPAESASKPVAKTNTKPAGKTVARQSEKTAKSAEPTKKQLRAGASQKTDNYLSKLVRHLSAYRDYPRRARRLGLQGTPLVVFEFDRAGRLLNYRLLQGSSHRILDDAALNMLKLASPFPPVPDDMTSETFRFQLPVAFQLR